MPMMKIYCNCGNEIETDFPELYNTVEQPDIYRQILDGTFLSVRCKNCDTLLKPEIPVKITDPERKIELLFRPDNERLQFLSGKLDLPAADRVVFGYPELAEMVIILMHDLDDRVVEIIKYFYIKKSGPGADISVFLDTVSDDKLRFRIHGLRSDEIGLVDIGKDFYKKIQNDLKEILKKEDLHEVLAPPYVSINKVYFGEE